MKILFFVSSLHAGGAERVATTLVSAWARQGHTVLLVPTYTGKGRCFYPLDKDVKLIWLADRMGALRHKVSAPIAKWFAIRRLVRETKPDIIVSFLTNVNVNVLLAVRGLCVPVIVCERTNPAFSLSAGKFLQVLRRITYPWASAVCLQTQASAVDFRRIVPSVKRLLVIPNPLPPELLAADEVQALSKTGQRHRLVAMGRLVSIKQFSWLVQVFSTLAADFPDWDLYIWGEGPLRTELSQQVTTLGLADRIVLAGRTEQPWIELAHSDVFALTSAVEGFPNVLLEAMALSLPCVTVDCPSGPRELSNDGQDALLVPLHDTPALQQALRQLMQDPVLRKALGQQSAESIRHRYALPKVLQLWETAMIDIQQNPPLEARP